MEKMEVADNQDIKELHRNRTHGYLLERTKLGNTLLSIISSQSTFLKVLNYVFEVGDTYNGRFITNGRRIKMLATTLDMHEKAVYPYITKLVELKILIKITRGEYMINPHLVKYV